MKTNWTVTGIWVVGIIFFIGSIFEPIFSITGVGFYILATLFEIKDSLRRT